MAMKVIGTHRDPRMAIDRLFGNDKVVVKGFDSLARHLADLEILTHEMAYLLAEEYGPMTTHLLNYLRLALESEVQAARILNKVSSAADTPETRIALEAIRRCSDAIRILAYRRLECLWEVIALREGAREEPALAEQLIDELHRCPAIH
jgi:hypothetical protein